jgi:DNA polymerase-3 subunit gamma/tau
MVDHEDHTYISDDFIPTHNTTTARLFGKEVNNFKGQIIEIDAASHNGVEDARYIIENARTQSLDGEYKVFLLDEVHMLSTAAWNALLKIVEEPPAKSLFIFCTTDPQKIPATILSRVQRFNFQICR